MSCGAAGGAEGCGAQRCRCHRRALSTGGFCIPLYIPYVLTGEWRLGRGLCKLWLVVDYLVCTASVFNIVLISFDRFISVTKAVRAGQVVPRRGCRGSKAALSSRVVCLGHLVTPSHSTITRQGGSRQFPSVLEIFLAAISFGRNSICLSLLHWKRYSVLETGTVCICCCSS